VVVGETAEEANVLHELFVFLVLQNDDLLHCFTEGVAVDSPQTAVFACLHRKSPGGFVEKSDFTKAIAYSEGLLDLIVGLDLHHALLDYEEAHGLGALVEDEGVAVDAAIEHLLGNVFYLGFAEVIEDEVVLETSQQEGHFLVLLFFFLQPEDLLEVTLVQGLLVLGVLTNREGTYYSDRESMASLSLSIPFSIIIN
jgi:hypothetical protein